MGAICLSGAICSALGLLWLRDFATTDQVLDTAVLSEK